MFCWLLVPVNPAVAGIERLDGRQVQQRAGAGGREQIKIDRAGKRPRTKARRGIAGRGKAVDVDLSAAGSVEDHVGQGGEAGQLQGSAVVGHEVHLA